MRLAKTITRVWSKPKLEFEPATPSFNLVSEKSGKPDEPGIHASSSSKSADVRPQSAYPIGTERHSQLFKLLVEERDKLERTTTRFEQDKNSEITSLHNAINAQHLLRTTLEENIETLQSTADAQNDRIAKLEAELEFLAQHNESLKSQLDNDSARATQLENERDTIANELRVSKAWAFCEKGQLEETIKSLTLKAADEEARHAKRVADLESKLQWTQKGLSGPASALLGEIDTLRQFQDEAEERLVHAQRDFERRQAERKDEKRSMQAEIMRLLGMVTSLRQDLSTARSDSQAREQEQQAKFNSEKRAFATEIVQYKENLAVLQADNIQLKQQLGAEKDLHNTTEAHISLLKEALKEAHGALEQAKSVVAPFTGRLAMLAAYLAAKVNTPEEDELDAPLGADRALSLLADAKVVGEAMISSSMVQVEVCRDCQIPRFSSEIQWSASDTLRASGFTPCCTNKVCKRCSVQPLLAALKSNWWLDCERDDVVRIRCLAGECLETRSLENVRQLRAVLEVLGCRDMNAHVLAYERAKLLRQDLLSLDDHPSQDAMEVCQQLHQQLEGAGLLLPSYGRTTGEGEDIMLADVEVNGTSYKVPIFTSLFVRSYEEKECCICASSYSDIAYESEDAWRQACAGYYGTWMWKVSPFPSEKFMVCQHEADVCKKCIERHLESKLDELGRGRCEELSCMMPDCGRRFTYEEVKFFANEATYLRYDKYLLLNQISSEPNFRWCLNEHCLNGQLYEDIQLLDPRIQCEECGFLMCFRHQTPWHEGLTCDQHDTRQEHGDAHHYENRGWIEQNTKQCPGCNASIEKNRGCFHMTCPCGYEFCWECLANWSAIYLQDGRYVQAAHNEGCYFLTGDRTPTQIAGRNLRDALRRA